MTGIVAIDECGDLGKNGSRYFVMSAIMTIRSRYLLQTSKLIKNREHEEKYKNTSNDKKATILNTIPNSNVRITYVMADKSNPDSEFYGIYGNELYKDVLNALLCNILMTCPANRVNILIDRSSSISEKDFEHMCHSIMGSRVNNCSKFNSSSNKCIQIADYVAGAIWHMYERNETDNYSIISKSIRCP